jgi:predicted enzyme related to lactoylglutathione lyase
MNSAKTQSAPEGSIGASVIRDATEVMGMGSFSIIADPTGAALGLWQPKAK